jgi:DNA polymerase-3 subunit alpha
MLILWNEIASHGYRFTHGYYAGLDTCTEVTAKLLQLPGGRGGKFKLPTLELHEYLFNKPFQKRTMQLPMWRQQHVAFRAYSKRVFYKEELDVPASYFEDFQAKNPREIQLIGLKHINLKQASDQIRQQFGKKGSAGISKDELAENKKVLAEAKFAHLHNHTQFSVLQSTIGIGPLVAATAKKRLSSSRRQIPPT